MEHQASDKHWIYLRHKVGWCPVCRVSILDSGYSDDLGLWEHVIITPLPQRQP